MALLAGVPGPQRLVTGEALALTVQAADDVAVSWWRDGERLPTDEPRAYRKSSVETADTGSYAVRAVKGEDEEIHAIPVTVAPAPSSISVDLPRVWEGRSVGWSLALTVLLAAVLAAAPVIRAFWLSPDGGPSDGARIALVITATGVVLVLAGLFVGVVGALARAQAKQDDTVAADGVDPVALARVVAAVDRPRAAAALLVAGLLVLVLAAVLGWRLA
jgi:hypothetical protein